MTIFVIIEILMKNNGEMMKKNINMQANNNDNQMILVTMKWPAINVQYQWQSMKWKYCGVLNESNEKRNDGF